MIIDQAPNYGHKIVNFYNRFQVFLLKLIDELETEMKDIIDLNALKKMLYVMKNNLGNKPSSSAKVFEQFDTLKTDYNIFFDEEFQKSEYERLSDQKK